MIYKANSFFSKTVIHKKTKKEYLALKFWHNPFSLLLKSGDEKIRITNESDFENDFEIKKY